MKIERVMHHAVSPAELYTMSITPEYQERKCEDAGALHWEVDVHVQDDDTAVVRAKRKLPTVGFPSIVRKVVPSGVTSTERITWRPAAADGTRVADVQVDFHGAPARMNGTIRLAPEPDGAVIVIEADFAVHVPLVGRKIEQLSASIILDVIESEERTAREWVSQRS